MHAVIASAGDESPGGDGTVSGGGLRAPMEPGANDPWRPLSSHLQPTWAPQPERKCGDQGPAAAASAAEDHKRALVHALQKDIRALESDMSSRMSVLLERLDELLQLQAHEDRHESAWATQT